MRRDFDLIRKIILAIEELPTSEVPEEFVIEGYSSEQIGYHNFLIIDAGLAEGVDVGGYAQSSPNWELTHLTSAGHDFAEVARNETLWRQARGLVKEKAGGVTLEVLKDVLVAVVRGTLGLP